MIATAAGDFEDGSGSRRGRILRAVEGRAADDEQFRRRFEEAVSREDVSRISELVLEALCWQSR